MKNVVFCFTLMACITFRGNAQVLSNIDEVAPFNEGLAAVKKGTAWGFIDTNGTLVIDFREDVVSPSKGTPSFNDGLCLIQETEDGIIYYGYIDTTGKRVIPPEYLAATPFKNGFARVIKYYEVNIGTTNVLGKNIVKFSYNELVITPQNKVVQHLQGPFNLLLDKKNMKQNPPRITSKFIADKLVAVKEKDNRYTIYKIEK